MVFSRLLALFLGIVCIAAPHPVFAKKKVKIQERDVSDPSPQGSLKALYYSLDPTSVTQHLAFYELYPETKEGKESLAKAWKLLSGGKLPDQAVSAAFLPKLDVQGIISLVTRQSFDPPVKLNAEQLEPGVEDRCPARQPRAQRV